MEILEQVVVSGKWKPELLALAVEQWHHCWSPQAAMLQKTHFCPVGPRYNDASLNHSLAKLSGPFPDCSLKWIGTIPPTLDWGNFTPKFEFRCAFPFFPISRGNQFVIKFLHTSESFPLVKFIMAFYDNSSHCCDHVSFRVSDRQEVCCQTYIQRP